MCGSKLDYKENSKSENQPLISSSDSIKSNGVSIFRLSLVNTFGGLIFGYNTGVISMVLALPFFKDNYSEINQGLLTCSILVGAMVGSIVGGIIMEKLGRKIAMLMVSILTVVGAIGISLVPLLWGVIVFRAILGIGVGISAIVCPTYVGEMSPTEKKGTLGTIFQLAITSGIFISNALGFALLHVQYNYRAMFIIGAAPGLCLFATFFFIPESTKWLNRNNTNPATDLLINQKKKHSSNNQGIQALFTKPIGRFSLFIGIVLAINNQLTGINAFMFFSPSIFQKAGITSLNYTMISTICLVGWNVVTTFIATFLIDRVGRRKLMLVGTLVMAVACVGLAILNLLIKGTTLGVLSIVLLFIFIAGFEASAGPLFWILVIEIFPEEMREAGSSLLNAIQWVFNIALSFSFLSLSQLIGQSAIFFIFGGFGIVCLIIMYIYLPETKNDDEDEDEE
ncbi:hypothetical protein DICPUDRAFT_81183 [Dictyostelium purpureum]|uniref:Major facilitator superfamily (MFS) profile domain-containing protein n=1 Tax=Dictyostelium purpureum TaxID=5786 RepID=F0ZSR2_DICPU|nr:uncharacterized protein DICPUDRAFT_81183 [Dictyostelium purpureum]EGC33031.1 hypothetical protein DICPUDRAFT_81183 [Dictyostelium purpureum]|eukprot:XP_003290458.1 hypothetical protein DICPUDRAFT_81183 [Dictyostelium purpureum]